MNNFEKYTKIIKKIFFSIKPKEFNAYFETMDDNIKHYFTIKFEKRKMMR